MKRSLIYIVILLLISCNEKSKDLKMRVIEMKEVSTTLDHSIYTSSGGMSNHGSFVGDGIGSLEKSIVMHNKELANIVAARNNILVVDLKGFLLYLNSNDLSVLWKSEIEVTSYFDPLIYNNRIYLVSYNGLIYEVDKNSGEFLNIIKLDSYFNYRPLILNDYIFLINTVGDLLKISGSDAIVVSKELPKYGKWIVLDEKIYLVTSNGKLIVIDSDGNLESYNTMAAGEYAISGGLSYIFLKGKNLKILSTKTMEEVYSFDINSGNSESVSLDTKEFFIYTETGSYKLLSLSGYIKLWEGNLGSRLEYKAIIVGNDILLTSKRSIYVLDKITGIITKELLLNSTVLYQPVYANNAVFVITDNGLYKISSSKISNYTPVVYDILEAGELKSFPLSNKGITLEFNPLEDGEYNIHSPTMEEVPIEIEIFSKDNVSLSKNVGYVSYQEDFINTFSKDEKYYIYCKALSEEVGDFSLVIK